MSFGRPDAGLYRVLSTLVPTTHNKPEDATKKDYTED